MTLHSQLAKMGYAIIAAAGRGRKAGASTGAQKRTALGTAPSAVAHTDFYRLLPTSTDFYRPPNPLPLPPGTDSAPRPVTARAAAGAAGTPPAARSRSRGSGKCPCPPG